jgi:hypothetical protein
MLGVGQQAVFGMSCNWIKKWPGAVRLRDQLEDRCFQNGLFLIIFERIKKGN